MTPASNGIARLLLGLIAGGLVTAGWLSPEGVESFITLGEYTLGGLLAVVTGAWTLYAKRPTAPEAKTIAIDVVEKTVSDTAGAPVIAEIESTLVK